MDLPDELKIPDEVLKELKVPELFCKHIEEGSCLQEILGYSDTMMEQLYSAAYKVFQEGRYEDAQDNFILLTTLNPYVYAYWLGLGMSYQLVEEYEQAILAYEGALATKNDAAFAYYYLAACHLYLNNYDESLQALKMMREKCKNIAENQELMNKAQHAETMVLKRKKQGR